MTKYSNYTFIRIDVKNRTYNPRGRYNVENYSFPFDDKSFDLILLKSVFTHMNGPGIDNYLKEVARLLSNKGRSLITFFLLNEKQQKLANKGLNKLDFKFGNKKCRYVYKNSPESAIVYDENYIMRLLSEHNLILKEPILYGTWSGRKNGISYQDMMLIQKMIILSKQRT